jgi:hypothetical protein
VALEQRSVAVPPGEPVPDALVALTRSLRPSARFPELDRVLCEASGTAWRMRRPRAGASHRLLLPVEADGTVGRPLRVPAAWRVLAVQAGRVVAVLVGEEGAESVGAWRVEGEVTEALPHRRPP